MSAAHCRAECQVDAMQFSTTRSRGRKRKHSSLSNVRDPNVCFDTDVALFQENEATKIAGKLVRAIHLPHFSCPDILKQFHGMKEVTKAAKKAKAFETRKIVKRLKASGFVSFFMDMCSVLIS